jgi:predicted ATPase/DNA-binding SARP family transcriptional activator
MRLRLLGGFDLVDDTGNVIDVGGGHQRRILAVLAIRPDAVVTIDEAVEALWGDRAPKSAVRTLRSLISRLRRVLAEAGADLVIESEGGGYRLRLPRDGTDVAMVESLASVARTARAKGDSSTARAALREAISSWRGRALGHLAYDEFARAEATRLDELRLTLLEELFDTELACGNDSVVGDLEALCAEHPLRERFWGQRILALYRGGRQAEALRVYQDLRTHLAEELGLEPSTELQQLEAAILAQSPDLVLSTFDRRARVVAGTSLPAGIVTFLATDIAGSSTLWERFPTEMVDALARHDEILEHAVTMHGGIVFKNTGDGVLAAFSSAAAAVRSAIAIQQALAKEEWGPVGPLRVRAALNSGEVRPRDGDYVGVPVNRVARILAIGHGGQILAAQPTVDLIGHLPEHEGTFVYLGEHRLRDLERPERVFHVDHLGSIGDFAPLRSLNAALHNLPISATAFIGRDDDLSALQRELTAARGLLTLTGAGGVGKTRLALQLAAETAMRFPDGVWLCELAPLQSGSEVAIAVGSALGIGQISGGTIDDAIVSFLRPQRALLILDNCEHVLSEIAALTEKVLLGTTDLRVLATSREALAIDGERVRPVRPLRIPARDDERTPDALLGIEAVQLFLDRACAVRPDFELNPESAPAVAEICERLDGIPLALELAAAKVRSMTVSEVAERLGERFHLLTAGRRTAVERHQTLRTAVTWSHDLLNERDRIVFRRLGVFAGFDLVAAEAVVADDSVERSEVLDALDSLVTKSMVIAEAAGSGAGSTRYRLLETLRQFAVERLAEACETERVRQLHAQHYASFMDAVAAGLRGPDEQRWIGAVEQELDNLRIAMQWATDERDVDVAMRLMGSTNPFILLFDVLGLAICQLVKGVLELPGANLHPGFDTACMWADFGAVYTADATMLGHWGRVAVENAATLGRDPVPEVVMSQTAGWMFAGQEDEVKAALRESVELARRSGDRFVLASCLANTITASAAFFGADAELVPRAEEAVTLARELQTPSLLVRSLYGLGILLGDTDEPRALAALDEADSIATRPALFSHGAALAAARIRGRAGHGDALRRMAPVVDALVQSSNRTALAFHLSGLAAVLAQMGMDEAAIKLAAACEHERVAPVMRMPLDAIAVAAAEARLDPDRVAALRVEGASWTYDEVVDHVRQVIAETSDAP